MRQNFENSEQIIDQLKLISDQLADRALSILKDAHAAGESKRPEEERV